MFLWRLFERVCIYRWFSKDYADKDRTMAGKNYTGSRSAGQGARDSGHGRHWPGRWTDPFFHDVLTDQEMANRARAFGMRIQYHNRSRLPADLEAGAAYVSFDELLANADVLSLNLALNASTRHIIGEAEFRKMKEGVVIVNTARGALIDEKALVQALESGKVSCSGYSTG